MNLYYNNIFTNSQKKFEYIKIDEISKHFKIYYIMIKDFWKELHRNKELVYKILKYAKKEDLEISRLNYFFMQNFYIDLFSNSNEFSNELYYIINKLINDFIKDLKKLEEFDNSFNKSNLACLLDGLILNNKIRSFFNLILSDIIEQYENSEQSKQIILFKVEDIENHFNYQEQKMKQEYLSKEKQKNIEEIKTRKRQNTFLSKLYKMKIPHYKNEESINYTYIEFKRDEKIEKDYKNNEIFANNYLPELNKSDILELLNKEKSEIMKEYIRKQLELMDNNVAICSSKPFLKNIQKSKESEKYLFFYQKNFMTTINIIKQIFARLNEYINIIPEEIKIISIMLIQSLKNKFNWIKIIDIYKYVSSFFMRILKHFFLYPDYNALINSIILSKNSKDNLKRIFDILEKLLSGNFYRNTDCSDFTPFNLFFLEIIPEVFNFFEKLLDNGNFDSKIFNVKYFDCNGFNENKNINTTSIVYCEKQINIILKIINDNYDKIFLNNIEDKSMDDFLKIFKKLNEKEKKEDNRENKIFFFAYNEILYSEKLLDIINRNKNKYFKIKELKEDKTKEEVNLNKIIRAKNLFFDLLYISPKLYKIENISTNSKGKNTKEILIHLNKYFKGISNYNETKSNNILETNDIENNSEQSKIPKEWYINSLMVCLENLDNEYSSNDYEKLYTSIKEDLNKSINNYNFGELGRILRNLKSIAISKNKFIILQEKYKEISINLKIRNFIENESLEAIIQFIYNKDRKIFNITKVENNTNKKHSKHKKHNNINNDKSIFKCLNINDFINKFPDLALIQQKQDIDLFLIESEINLSQGLNQYFDILRDLIEIKFDKDEKNLVFIKIQKYILVKIYEKIYPSESDKDDMKTFQKTIILSWVQPNHLKLDNTYLDNFIPITTNYFNQLDNEKSPNGKFNIINKIFNEINTVLKFNKGNSFSIDDIAPICEYCLIKAQPERLSSNLKYLKNFISNNGSDLRKMRFDILRNCMNSIIDINYTKLEGVSKEEFDKLCIIARGMPLK